MNHEYQGRHTVPETVERGLKRIHDLGRPVVINTLRFPLSVIRTFGKAWYQISNAPVPTVLMNGSRLGYIVETHEGMLGYEEIAAFPLSEVEIDGVMAMGRSLIADGTDDLLVFYYPRKWSIGEIIWTPAAEKIISVQGKYLSASSVVSTEIGMLHDELKSQDICMIFLLINVAEDKLMSYQHAKQSNFFTREGVDKLYGAQQISKLLNFEMDHSLGAGDGVIKLHMMFMLA